MATGHAADETFGRALFASADPGQWWQKVAPKLRAPRRHALAISGPAAAVRSTASQCLEQGTRFRLFQQSSVRVVFSPAPAILPPASVNHEPRPLQRPG